MSEDLEKQKSEIKQNFNEMHKIIYEIPSRLNFLELGIRFTATLSFATYVGFILFCYYIVSQLNAMQKSLNCNNGLESNISALK